ncbi:MAG: hypothetical protein ACRD37_07015, partial [Candidatus Acidiferrales bacterium]
SFLGYQWFMGAAFGVISSAACLRQTGEESAFEERPEKMQARGATNRAGKPAFQRAGGRAVPPSVL